MGNVSILALQTASFLYMTKQEEPMKMGLWNTPIEKYFLSFENVVEHKQWHSLLSYGFIHLQLDHFLLNQLSVFLFANSQSVQNVLRSPSALATFYVSSLLIGSLSFLTEQYSKLKYYETVDKEETTDKEMRREFKQKCCGSSAASYALFTLFCNVFEPRVESHNNSITTRLKQRIYPQVKFIPNIFFWIEMVKLVFIPSEQKLDDPMIHMAAILFGYTCTKFLRRR